jgi:FkbM family methyltransferase
MKKLSKSVLHRLYSHFLQIGHANTDPFFQCLLNIGFEPKHIIDVGAHKGGWTRSALKYFPKAHYSLFEPQRDLLECQHDLTKNPRIRMNFLGAGPVSETRKMTTSPRIDSFTFIWNNKEAIELGCVQFDVEVVSLDEFFSRDENLLAPADLVKIDAEGWDLEVLKGAETTISRAEVVLLEAGIMNKKFENNAREVINIMYEKGFLLFDVTDLNRTPLNKGLWNVELAFVRKGGRLEQAIDSYE